MPARSRRFAVLVVLASFGAPGAIASRARAYERARVEGAPALAVYWPARTLAVRLTPEMGGLLDVDLRDATSRSLATWTGAGGCTDMTLGLGPNATSSTTNLDGGPFDGENRIVFRRAWPASIGPETVALTTYAYRPSTGEILDADIDLNAESSTFSATVAAPPAGVIDVENTLTHELGHLLGFAHVLDPEATMYGGSAAAETLKRDLSLDDVRAVCETYPVGAVTPPAPPPPLPPPAACGCAVSRTGRAGALGAFVLLVALSVRAAWRSHRPARKDGTACATR